jgi:predicted component of type VI protein secretion system
MTPITAIILAKQVENVIENFEPRALLAGVKALPNLDRNAYEVSVKFYIVNAPTELINLTLPLERLR